MPETHSTIESLMIYFTNFHKLKYLLLGYYHIKHDKTIYFLNQFNTPFGRFRCTRMPFGLPVAGDTFQHKLDMVICNLDFCKDIADDMIIWGEQPDGNDKKHLHTEFMQVTRKHTLKLNID